MDYYDYLKAFENYFWQWEDFAEVLAIPGGSTIAYTEKAMEIVEHLAPQGIPFFGSLLLTLIATNTMPGASIDAVDKKVSMCLSNNGPANSTSAHFTMLKNGIDFLRTLATLPPDYKEGKRRLLLLQTIFAASHNLIAADKAKNILYQYKRGYFKPAILLARGKFSMGIFTRDFRCLQLLQKKFPDVTSILHKMAGLPAMQPAPELIDEP